MRPPWILLLLPQMVLAGIAAEGQRHYSQLKRFELVSMAEVQDLTIRKDRIEIHLNGKLYLEPAVAGKTHGAIFVGTGRVHIENPPVEFEKDNVKRLLKVDSIDTTFQTAVLRCHGGFLDAAAKKATPQPPSAEARELASKFEEKLLKKTGLNVSARIARAMVNEIEGEFLLAEFDKGPLGRFSVLFDDEGQVPSALFLLNAGERGLVFRYVEPTFGSDIVLAFLPKESYETGRFQYSDVFQAIDVQKYSMKIDATDVAKRSLRNAVTIAGRHLRPASALFFQLNHGLGEAEDERKKRGALVTKADGDAIVVQEPWEIGATVFLDKKPAPGDALQLTLTTEGKPIYSAADGEYLSRQGWWVDGLIVTNGTEVPEDTYYPAATTSWYPNNGLLDRAQFEVEFLHRKGLTAIAVGAGSAVEDAGDGHFKTSWRTERELGFASFAIGRFEVDRAKTPKTGVDIAYYSPALSISHDKQTLMMTELANGVDFYSELFGAYPYGTLKGVFHPRMFGQGFSSMVMLPPLSKSGWAREHICLVSHEVSHQWWGNIVGWRSYRDQWLSEGFAEYSSALYLKARYDAEAMHTKLRRLRNELNMPSLALKSGAARTRVADIGPMILGLRLATTETFNAYRSLTYAKGGLVLRMVHFLLTNPADGNDTLFFEMLRDFAKRYQDRPASTEDFANVAGEYFNRSPIGRKYSYRHLGWFFRQWVYQAHLPTYRLEYKIRNLPDGKAMLEGTLFQEGVPDNWEMPLPLALRMDKDRVAHGTVLAKGPSIAVSIPLPVQPKEVQLNVNGTVLCERVSVKRLD